jgi:hypothetical protein
MAGETMTYRILPPDEWVKLFHVFEQAGFSVANVPSPEVALACVAEDENQKIEGVVFLQMAFHMEPLICLNGHVHFPSMQAAIHEACKDHKGMVYYAFSASEKINRIAEISGFTKTDYVVWKGEVT